MHPQFRIAFAATLVVALVLSATPAFAEDIAAPNVVGTKIEDAIARIERAGLVPEVVETAGPTPGLVASQEPDAGTRLPRGEYVVVRVGIKARIPTNLPDVTGKKAEDAADLLISAYDIRFEPVDGDPRKAGTVLRTDPAANTSVLFRAPVTIYVIDPEAVRARAGGAPTGGPGPVPGNAGESGPLAPLPRPDVSNPGLPPPPGVSDVTSPIEPARPTSVPVPDLVGRSGNEARAMLIEVGLKAQVLNTPGGTPGRVLRQEPEAGSEILAGARVVVYVGSEVRRSAPAPVPEVYDGVMPTDDLQPPAEFAPPSPEGMLPGGRDPIVDGGLLPDGVEPGKMPDLMGKSFDDAQAILLGSGYIPRVWLMPGGNVEPWTVYAQKVRPGEPVAAGSVIEYRVAPPGRAVGDVPIPSIVGLPLKQAVQILGAFGLRVRITNGVSVNDPDVVVASQEPDPGLYTQRGTVLPIELGTAAADGSIEVGSGQPAALPPRTAGDTPVFDAPAAPESPDDVSVFGEPDPSDVSVFGDPEPEATPSSPDDVSVFDAPSSAPRAPAPEVRDPRAPTSGRPAPRLVGLKVNEAREVARRAGLFVRVETRAFRAAAPARIYEQSPAAGALQDVRKPIVITVPDQTSFPVGEGRPLYAKVPDVTGRMRYDAMATVNGTGLRAVVQDRSGGHPQARIVAQSLHPNALIRQGTPMTLVLESPNGPVAPAPVTAGEPPREREEESRDPLDRAGRFFKRTHKKVWGEIKDLFR